MSRSAFTIAYDGPALAGHTMDVRDLAPAMLGIGQLCDAANSVLNGERSKINVHIKATGSGSFQIEFHIIQNIIQDAFAFFSRPEVSAAVNLQNIIFGAGGTISGITSLVLLIKKLKGKKIEKAIDIGAGSVRISIESQDFDISLDLLRLYQDIAVRNAVQKVVEEPLKSSGVDTFKVIDGESTVISIDKEESEYFSNPKLEDEDISENTIRSAYSIISLAFKDENKWRLNDGANQITAAIEDRDFLDKVNSNQISFAKGDILICEIKILTKQTQGILKTEYTVLRVIEHRPAARQIPISFDFPTRGEPGDR